MVRFREMTLSYFDCWQDEFASLDANFGGGLGLLVYPILIFSRHLSGRSPDMTEILLTGTIN